MWKQKRKKDRIALALPLNFVLFLVRVFIPLMYQSSTRLEYLLLHSPNNAACTPLHLRPPSCDLLWSVSLQEWISLNFLWYSPITRKLNSVLFFWVLHFQGHSNYPNEVKWKFPSTSSSHNGSLYIEQPLLLCTQVTPGTKKNFTVILWLS